MAETLERWGLVLMGVGATIFGLASLAEAATESVAWTDVAIGVAALMFGAGVLIGQLAKRGTPS